MIKLVSSISVLIIASLPFAIEAQQIPKEKALTYFNKYLSKKQMNDLILGSFPTITEARKIFVKEEDAKQFMKLMVATEKKMKEQPASDDETFSNIEINTFTVKDIKNNNTNYNLGLLEILDKFKPDTRFFTVKMMRAGLFENGFSYLYWVNFGDNWFFISNPNQAFKK